MKNAWNDKWNGKIYQIGGHSIWFNFIGSAKKIDSQVKL